MYIHTYLTYQHSCHNLWKLKLSNISTFIYTFLHYYLCCSTPILFCYNCYAWRSYILWLHCSYYYCILSQPISKTQKQYKIKKLVSTPTPLPFISHSSSRLRERKCKAYYMVIHLSVFSCLHLYHIILYTCSLSLGQRGKCTVYVCTFLCTVQ